MKAFRESRQFVGQCNSFIVRARIDRDELSDLRSAQLSLVQSRERPPVFRSLEADVAVAQTWNDARQQAHGFCRNGRQVKLPALYSSRVADARPDIGQRRREAEFLQDLCVTDLGVRHSGMRRAIHAVTDEVRLSRDDVERAAAARTAGGLAAQVERATRDAAADGTACVFATEAARRIALLPRNAKRAYQLGHEEGLRRNEAQLLLGGFVETLETGERSFRIRIRVHGRILCRRVPCRRSSAEPLASP